MKHIIIGTAGHVDHGKTSLIRALTHIETDRLKEEQQRGISIEIGFAYFDLPSGRRAGIIDVPGHERFIKNMLAGISGVDLALLVVAADEGVMPQTTEHLNILSLLQIRQGLVVVTKTDLVDQEWLELVTEEITESLQGTFLAQSAIYPVSVVTGEGLPQLVAAIDALTQESLPKDTTAPLRLPVDRAFTVAGFGTVVTGTLISGAIAVGDRVELLPRGIAARVRTIQVHGEKVGEAYAGQRTAINLAGIDLAEVQRGDVLAAPGFLHSTMMLDVRVQLLAGAPHPLAQRTRVRLYSGAAEVMARLVPLEEEEILPGESGLAQLRLEAPLAVAAGDILIFRSYSPMVTIAGGRVIDAAPRKKTRFRTEQVAELLLREQGDPLEQGEQIIANLSPELYEKQAVLQQLQHLPHWDELVEELLVQERAVVFQADNKEYLVASSWLEKTSSTVRNALTAYHQANPLRLGVPREELRSRLLKQGSSRLFLALLLYWESEGWLLLRDNMVALAGFTIQLSPSQERLLQEIRTLYTTNPFAPPSYSDLGEKLSSSASWRELFNLLLAQGELVKLSEDIYLSRSSVALAEQHLRIYCEEHREVTLGAFRDLLNTSRKYALPLLEYFDNERLTQRRGEARILRGF